MEKAAKIVAETLEMSREAIIPGISTWDIDKKIEDFIINKGGIPSFKGYHGFPGSACVSVNEVLIHGIPSKDRIILDGDIVTIDVGVILGGFHGDAARTFAIGNVSEEKRMLVETTYKALEIAIETLREAERLGEMGYAVQRYVEEKGYSIIRDFGGHGIGREMHEDPFVPNYGIKNSGPKIRTGMTLAIEPMISTGDYQTIILEDGWTVINVDRSLNAHFEDDIAFTEDGLKILSRL